MWVRARAQKLSHYNSLKIWSVLYTNNTMHSGYQINIHIAHYYMKGSVSIQNQAFNLLCFTIHNSMLTSFFAFQFVLCEFLGVFIVCLSFKSVLIAIYAPCQSYILWRIYFRILCEGIYLWAADWLYIYIYIAHL